MIPIPENTVESTPNMEEVERLREELKTEENNVAILNTIVQGIELLDPNVIEERLSKLPPSPEITDTPNLNGVKF